jgi:3-oxoacyl-[acyl-carrier protein] reductase
MELHLKDKAAVIIGGSIEIGLAIAEGLANEGTHLLLCSKSKPTN